ncbi:MAG TPA: NAD-dependent epimerase/dehydratase family protein [Allosphingosinicella sp.]|jgi:nucleoside-diphosphate-sugar epimerase
MKKILFLGGSGFLGRQLIRSLTSDVQPYAIARSIEGEDRIKDVSPSIRIVSPGEAAKIRFDRIFNLVVDYGRGGAPIAQLIQPNLIYPLQLLETIEADAVLNVSTALPQNYSNYALTKKLLEQSLDYLGARRGRPFVNIHLHNMYGPGAEVSEFVGFVILRMLAGEPVEVSHCRNSRDFIFVADAVSALSLLCASAENFAPGSPVEVGTGRSTCLRDLLFTIRELTGSSSEIRFGAKPGNGFEPDRLVADTTALQRLGWTPRHSLRQGLQTTIEALAASRPRVAQPI